MVMAYIVVAYVVMGYMVMATIAMAYTVVAALDTCAHCGAQESRALGHISYSILVEAY